MVNGNQDYRKSDRQSLLAAFDWPKAANDKTRSLADKETYWWILDGAAYKDFTARTITGATKDASKGIRKALACKLYDYMNYIDSSDWLQSDYDKWHWEICDEFVRVFNGIPRITKIAFGKAQKIVNMSFKYFFCLLNAEDKKYAEKFRYCHMPLDSFTLAWYKQAVVPWHKEKYNNKGKNVYTRFVGNRLKTWSNLEYGISNDPHSYSGIQRFIREYLSEGRDGFVDEAGCVFTPFKAEFYIWQEQQLLTALKNIQSNSKIIQSSYPSYRNGELERLCQESESALAGIAGHFK